MDAEDVGTTNWASALSSNVLTVGTNGEVVLSFGVAAGTNVTVTTNGLVFVVSSSGVINGQTNVVLGGTFGSGGPAAQPLLQPRQTS